MAMTEKAKKVDTAGSTTTTQQADTITTISGGITAEKITFGCSCGKAICTDH
jgi:hypothetical protein